MKHGRSGAAALLVLVLGAGGCTSDSGGADPDGETSPTRPATSAVPASVVIAADDAAAAYLRDLRRYQRQLDRAATLSATATSADSARDWRAAERLFVMALGAAPTLEDVEDGAEGSASYARAVEVAERAQGFVHEHDWMTGWDRDENVRVHTALYAMSSDQYAHALRLGSAYERTMAGPGATAVKMKRALGAQVAAELEYAATARREVEGLAGRDSFTPSLRDHLLHEIDAVVALGERYLEYVETTPAKAIDRDLFRNGFSGGAVLPGGAVANAPADRTVLARGLLADGVAQLVSSAGPGQGELPLAGDIYRKIIAGLFVPHMPTGGDERDLAVDEQLYWLWHLREIEGTPDDAFEDARLTIKLQHQGPRGAAVVNVDSRFDELAAISVVLADSINVPDEMAANKPWLVETLARPFPPVLEEAVTLARQAAELMPDSASTPASPDLLALGDPMFAAIEQAADDLDNTKRFRTAFRAAVDGTRPTDVG